MGSGVRPKTDSGAVDTFVKMLIVFPYELADNSMLYLFFFLNSKLVPIDEYIMVSRGTDIVACSGLFWSIQIVFFLQKDLSPPNMSRMKISSGQWEHLGALTRGSEWSGCSDLDHSGRCSCRTDSGT